MSSTRNQAVVPQATGDAQYNVRDAALRGASLAFSKPPVKPPPPANTYAGAGNGALLAATKVGTGRNSTTGSPAALKPDWTGGSSRSMQAASKSNSSSTLGVPDDRLDRVPSPSNIAARLAAARYSPLRPVPQAAAAPVMSERDANERDVLPPSGSVGNVLARFEPKKQPQQPRKRRDSPRSLSATGTAKTEQDQTPTDETPIPPTTSLVTMFEQNRPTTPLPSSTAPLNVAQNSPPPVRSPKPQRSFKLPPEPKDSHFTDGARDQADLNRSPPIKQKPMQLAAITTSAAFPPRPPPQRGSRTRRLSQDTSLPVSAQRIVSTSLESYGTPESPVSFKSAKEDQEEEEKSKPAVPPPRRSNTRKVDTATPVSLPQFTIHKSQPSAPVPIQPRNQSLAAPSLRPPERFSPPQRPASAIDMSSPSVYHNNYQRQSVQQITKHMTGESLSSAIMGAALAASSRNVSPAPRPMSLEPLFPPRKQHHHHHHLPFHRSPSPPKQSPPKSNKMRTTLRKEPSSSDDEDETEKYKKKGTRIMGFKGRKHPNKHHEGTRKRWRDQITDRERKRYEGLWAANKGLHIPPPPPVSSSSSPSPSSSPPHQPNPRSQDSDPTSTSASTSASASSDVSNLCVQDIWARSRLPTPVLAEVWDLVDVRGIGRLSRPEFVVGLWLIDQRLKGRKLPVRVSESVWASARGVGVSVGEVR